jgi:hypothetical protein
MNQQSQSTKVNRRCFLLGAVVLGEKANSAFAQGPSPINHIVLLGDSIFDNARARVRTAQKCALTGL